MVLRCLVLGLDLQTLFGALSSYGFLVHGLPPLLVIMLEVVLVRQAGQRRMVLHMPTARHMGVALVAVTVMACMWLPWLVVWIHLTGTASPLSLPAL